MKRIAATLVSLIVLSGTAVLLVADSAQKCPHADETKSFDVRGTCGPSGRITVQIAKDQCYFTVDAGPALGLPDEGQLIGSQDLATAQFTLAGSVTVPAPTDGGVCPADGGTDGGVVGCAYPGSVLADGGLEVTRYCSPADGGMALDCTDWNSCTAVLTPVP